ncbi:GGDEF domain-containing protein [Pseudidiomarina mangrovi]|uniref:GGDEF domain-containing protein n=1 Tax=Pseudidiomarina mangrovi TaxID=2487133 RepID=UPI000FCCC2E0|nr:GGDEF domain-containing protein [Pseudidiomarina mangrovi]
MHLPTLIGVTLLINLLLGAFMLVVFQLRRQVCFRYWAFSCWVFVLAGIFVAARNFIDQPWLTYWLADLLLISAPLLALLGILQFFQKPLLHAARISVAVLLSSAVMLALVIDELRYLTSFASLVIAGCFISGAWLVRYQPSRSNLSLHLLFWVYVAHALVMVGQAVFMLVGITEWFHAAVVSHIILTTATALLFPLLTFVQREDSLARLAHLDDLTQLSNRRAFFTEAPLLLELAYANQDNVSLMMIDLDHFKAINDQHGHAVGDRCLRWVARRLKAELREHDLIGRIGGEEFAVLLGKADHARAQAIGERLCQRIHASPYRHGDTMIALSISIGGVWAGTTARSLQALLADADQALYSAKQAGRNQLVMVTAAEHSEN